MVKKASYKIFVQLYYIMATSIKIFYFPNIWKKAELLAFPKPGKTLTSPANYRPISLLSIFSKVYERIIHQQLEKYLLKNEIIINEQFGFKREHSTVLQLLRVMEQFAMEMNKKRTSAMVLLNLKKAFDSVWHDGLVYKLSKINVPTFLIKIIRNYLGNRTFIVSFQGERSIPRGSITSGVPLYLGLYLGLYLDRSCSTFL